MTSGSTFNTLPSGLQGVIVQGFMDLFRSNQRGYGLGEFQGARFDEDKSKWIPGGVRWVWGETTEQQWHDHLSGVRLLGQGVLCDDNRVWYACLDVDIYDIDYVSEMSKVKQSKLPLVVFRTKSGGLRVTVFFSEAIEADLVIPRMKRVASLLGYAGCEIFPKQSKLDVTNGDCPSWIYVPYGGTGDSMFPEQGCMNEHGSLMDVAECLEVAKARRLSQNQFKELFAAEEHAKANGKANGKKHPKGAWIQEDSYDTTINTMFCDGPPCLWTISHNKSRDMQNNFLLNVASFLKRKYPENWEKALEYVNYNVLQPVGDREKLNGIVKRLNGHDYEYRCSDEPICSHCNPHACRRMPHGVGDKKIDIDVYELGLTITDREPRIFFVSIGGNRIQCSFEELWNLHKFQIKCGDNGISAPPSMNKKEWEPIVRKNIDEATHIPPSRVVRTNADELDLLAKFFEANIPNFVRMGEKSDDRVRVRIEEKRVYFKEKRLLEYCRMLPGGGSLATSMRWFINSKGEYHEQGPGHRDWWRSTYSITFDMFEESERERWFPKDDE